MAVIVLTLSVIVSCLFCLMAVALERADVDLWRGAGFNLTFYVLTSLFVVPILLAGQAYVVAVVNWAGGGFIHLPSGWLTPLSVVVVLLVTDLCEYAYHYAQHKIPFLWQFHALHHSEERYNATTAVRQSWFDSIVRGSIVLPAVGLVFNADPQIIVLARLLGFANGVQAHMSSHRSTGKLWWLLNSPQYHRCHHSFAERHIDKNLATFFPFWDVIFRTCYRPAPGEFEPTGLRPVVRPSLLEAVVWPVKM